MFQRGEDLPFLDPIAFIHQTLGNFPGDFEGHIHGRGLDIPRNGEGLSVVGVPLEEKEIETHRGRGEDDDEDQLFFLFHQSGLRPPCEEISNVSFYINSSRFNEAFSSRFGLGSGAEGML